MSAFVFDSRGRLCGEQAPQDVKVVFGRGEVQRRLARGRSRSDGGVPREEESDRFEAGRVFKARGNHERRPAGAVLDIGIKVLGVREECNDGEVVVGASPVYWQAGVIVYEGGEFRVGLKERAWWSACEVAGPMMVCVGDITE